MFKIIINASMKAITKEKIQTIFKHPFTKFKLNIYIVYRSTCLLSKLNGTNYSPN
jgi:hypothetical protein